jgi:hypothetical protein
VRRSRIIFTIAPGGRDPPVCDPVTREKVRVQAETIDGARIEVWAKIFDSFDADCLSCCA